MYNVRNPVSQGWEGRKGRKGRKRGFTMSVVVNSGSVLDRACACESGVMRVRAKAALKCGWSKQGKALRQWPGSKCVPMILHTTIAGWRGVFRWAVFVMEGARWMIV